MLQLHREVLRIGESVRGLPVSVLDLFGRHHLSELQQQLLPIGQQLLAVQHRHQQLQHLLQQHHLPHLRPGFPPRHQQLPTLDSRLRSLRGQLPQLRELQLFALFDLFARVHHGREYAGVLGALMFFALFNMPLRLSF